MDINNNKNFFKNKKNDNLVKEVKPRKRKSNSDSPDKRSDKSISPLKKKEKKMAY